jgi:hypothetical protein
MSGSHRWIVLTLGAMTAAFAACVGDSTVVVDGGPDVTTSDATPPGDGGKTDAPQGDSAAGAPIHAPTSITFADQDPTLANVSGTVTIGRAADESDVVSYKLYWGIATAGDGGAPPTKLTQITDLPKTGAAVTYNLAAAVPSGATYLIAVSSNASGEMATGAAVTPIDNHPVHTDLTGDAGVFSYGQFPSAAIDTTNNKLVVVTIDGQSNFRLTICNLDGTSCNRPTVGAAGTYPSLVVDSSSGKLLITYITSTSHLGVYRCDLNGSNCASIDVTTKAGQSFTLDGTPPSPTIDGTNALLDVAVGTATGTGRAGMFRCTLTFGSCSYVDVATSAFADASAGVGSGQAPSAVSNTGTIYVATFDYGASQKPGLFICGGTTTSCKFADISAGAGTGSGGYNYANGPSAAIDTTNGKLLVATNDYSKSGTLSLFRCALDGGACTYGDISAGRGAGCGWYPRVAIDDVNGKLYVATSDGTNSGKPALFRCNLDGTSCTWIDMSAGQGANSASTDSLALVIDKVNKRLLVVTDDVSGGDNNLALFSIGLW